MRIIVQRFAKKRVEILIERALLKRLNEALNRVGISDFSIVSLAGGSGQAGQWFAEGQVGEAAGMFAIWCIVDAEELETLLQVAFTIVSRQVGMVSVADVEVLRSKIF